jgi:alpha-L-fucosidase
MVQRDDEASTPVPYAPTWNSLKTHRTPQWFQEAKFGIYTHWGVYSVPAHGPNATWYPHYMYREGTPQHAYHVQTYGDPSQFGYKDFIPMFTAEKFDPDEWAEFLHVGHPILGLERGQDGAEARRGG